MRASERRFRSDVVGVPNSAAMRVIIKLIVTVVIPKTGSAIRARFEAPMDSRSKVVNSATAA